MRFKGKKIPAPKSKVVVFEREDDSIVFKLTPIVDEKEFDNKCPEPNPTRVVKVTGESYIDHDDPKYREALEQHSKKRWDWMLITTLRETEGLEWEKVNPDDPNTWHLFREELEDSGLTRAEVIYLINEIGNINIVTPEHMNEARDRFFRQKVASGPNG